MGIGNSLAPLPGNSRFRVPDRPGRVPSYLTQTRSFFPSSPMTSFLQSKKEIPVYNAHRG